MEYVSQDQDNKVKNDDIGFPITCDIFSGCSWDNIQSNINNIPELKAFDEDIFGADIDDKIKELDRIYGHFDHGRESDEVLFV